MALLTRSIRQKITSVKNIRKITKAMEMVAVSKMRRAVAAALAAREYSELARDILAAIAREHADEGHFLLQRGNGDRMLMVVVASNRGLCGGFNVALAKTILHYVAKEHGREHVDFVTIGRNADRLAKKISGNIRGSFEPLSIEQGFMGLLGLSRLVMDEFLSGTYESVMLAYNHYVSTIRYESVVRPLLPISHDALVLSRAISPKEGARARYLFEPNETQVLAEVLPRLVEVLLYQANLESAASEQSARMVAMKNASDSAGDMIEGLTLDFNHERQSGITQEISEISAGANALA